MSCTSPRKVGFLADGKTISWSPKHYSKEFAPFQLDCGKCISCRLKYAREWAIRCVHEASMYEDNCFVTLTYSDEKLLSPFLIYSDFQKFMKRLRFHYPNRQIGVFVTGEYGEKTKRPHWHAIIFNWRPTDATLKYTSDSGHDVYDSTTLERLWGHGITEFGSVTIDSAGYCARYAAKKLVHGYDGDHSYQPISKKSSKHAIGKKWLENNYRDVFTHGTLILSGGKSAPIPRYYTKWFKENRPEEYLCYITRTHADRAHEATLRSRADEKAWFDNETVRRSQGKYLPAEKKISIMKTLALEKFKRLQAYLKF